MPFPMRIQPIDSVNDVVKPPVLKSRLKRLFDRPFNSVLRISSAEKPTAGGEKDGGGAGAVAVAVAPEFEPSSVCLDKMVRNFMEDNEKHHGAAVKCGRHRCNCFNGNNNDSSDDEFDFFSDSLTPNSSFSDPSDTLKSLVPCASVAERNLLADASTIVERNNKTCKRKDDLRKIVTDDLVALGYDACVCKSKWEKSSIPAGEYEYIDVIMEGDRVLIDVDFRSEFEIARSTSSYKAILQSLPHIFVGKSDRLLQIVSIVSEAARQSLKKKGMHIAPWRKSEYMKSKWLSPHTRITPLLKPTSPIKNDTVEEPEEKSGPDDQEVMECEGGELDLIFGEKSATDEDEQEQGEAVLLDPETPTKEVPPMMTWQLPAVKPKSSERGNKAVITGLASLLKEKL